MAWSATLSLGRGAAAHVLGRVGIPSARQCLIRAPLRVASGQGAVGSSAKSVTLRVMDALRERMPGLIAAGATAAAASAIATSLPPSLHVSAIPVSICIGALLANIGPFAAPAVSRSALTPTQLFICSVQPCAVLACFLEHGVLTHITDVTAYTSPHAHTHSAHDYSYCPRS